MKRVLLIQGHPDRHDPHFCHALAAAYARGAREAGHEVRCLKVALLDFELVRSQRCWETQPPPDAIRAAQDDIRWAQHIVIFFPLWMGDMPALLKGFWEQALRPGFAFDPQKGGNPFRQKALAGRSARVVVTMGMPAAVYRLYFRAHSVKSLERNILGFSGIAPIDETLIGMVDAMKEGQAQRWLRKLEALGAEAG